MSECIFCKIVAGELPTTVVYEDEDVIAFEDINPVAPVHTLIIPRKHIATLNDATSGDQALLGRMMYRAKEIAREKGLAEDGYRIVMNCMAGAGQAVFHIHIHVVGGRALLWPPG